jgi:thiosulfate dehydrogenase
LSGQWERYVAAQLIAYRQGDRSNDSLGLMTRISRALTVDDIGDVAAYVSSLAPGSTPEAPRPAQPLAWQPSPQLPDTFLPPPDDAIPAGPYGDLVRLGQHIFEDTPKYAEHYARNALSCRNCHLDRGRAVRSSPMWAAYVHYPEYRKKDGMVNTIEMRIQGCFRYSQNGVVPPADSREITALVTYFHWLATGLPVGIKPKSVGYPRLAPAKQIPSPERGAKVYVESCAVCHGEEGQGRTAGGRTVFPPLWGAESFNWGAGMHQVDMAAAFIKSNMPYGAGDTLTDQEAWDVAAYINSRPRPQDPRFTESVEKTRELFHATHEFDFYGREVDGVVLGAPTH